MFPLTGFFCKEEPPFAGGLFFIFWLFTGLMTRLKHLAQHLRTSTNQSFSPWKPHLPFLHLPRLGASSHTKSLRSSTLSRPPPTCMCVRLAHVPSLPILLANSADMFSRTQVRDDKECSSVSQRLVRPSAPCPASPPGMLWEGNTERSLQRSRRLASLGFRMSQS